MKITLNWLRNYVDFDGSPEELAERLTMLGLEVESLQRLGGEFEGIVVAQVLSREKHPNADKLSLCRVADGRGERQIVCGAQNFQAGDKVPLIVPGASLPMKPGDREPFTIKVGKIRGVESHGMLCSANELGIRPEDIGHRAEDGLLILRPDAVVGQSFAAYLGRSGSDVVYDLEITPNRPDWNSVIGIAREIAAVTRRDLRIPSPALVESGDAVSQAVEVKLQVSDSHQCPRYTARVVRGVTVGPSPDWLRTTLEKVGLRSVNNVVDVTNYVMLETGQPLHAFDLQRVAMGSAGRPCIIVRPALDGEEFTTLDGVRHPLGADHLLIADQEKGIALAGVIGGANSGISASTVDVLIESANFSAPYIRRTSKALGIRTDASYRFERGADIEICERASRRCAELIVETAGGMPMRGVVDVGVGPSTPRRIELRSRRVHEVLGMDIPSNDQSEYLTRLGLVCNFAAQDGSTSSFEIPTWRVDLKREADLVEEIARLYGVDRIPATPPRGAVGSHPFDAVYDQMSEVRGTLVALGLLEAQGQTLINAAAAGRVSGDGVRLANPLSSDMDVLRPSLLPGLLDTLQHNLTRRNGDLQFFEMGRVFNAREGAAPREGWRVALALTGARNPAFWSGTEREAKCDLYDVKGLIEELLESLGLRGVVWTRSPEPSSLFLESATVSLGGRLVLGRFGQVQPSVARRYDLRDPVLLAELDLDLLLSKRNRSKGFKALPAFPASQRDVAMIVPETVTHEAVLGVVRKTQPAHLERVELFDVFRGRHVTEGFKSMAYAFTYRATDRTLKDDEVNASQAKLVEAFRQALAAVVRE